MSGANQLMFVLLRWFLSFSKVYTTSAFTEDVECTGGFGSKRFNPLRAVWTYTVLP